MNKKITDLTALTTSAEGDVIAIVDVSDTTDDAAGTSKKIARTYFFKNLPSPSADTDAATKGYVDTTKGYSDAALSARTNVIVSSSAYADYVTDGVEDDVQINAAIVAVNAAGGGTVEIKKGTYCIKNRVIMLSNVNIIAHEATFVGRTGGTVDDQMLFVASGVENIILDGGIFTKDALSDLVTLPVSGNIVASYHGFYLTGACKNIKIRNANFIGTYGNAIASCNEISVTGCYFEKNLAGVAAISSNGYSRNIVINDNIFKDGYDDAVAVIGQYDVGGIRNVSVVGNVFDHEDQTADSGRAVYIAGISGNLARDVVVTGNTIMNFQLEGIWLTNYTLNCVITGNVIDNTCISVSAARYGIQIDSGSAGNIIANNLIANQTYPVRVGGANGNLCGPNLKYNVANADSISSGNTTVISTAT